LIWKKRQITAAITADAATLSTCSLGVKRNTPHILMSDVSRSQNKFADFKNFDAWECIGKFSYYIG